MIDRRLDNVTITCNLFFCRSIWKNEINDFPQGILNTVSA